MYNDVIAHHIEITQIHVPLRVIPDMFERPIIHHINVDYIIRAIMKTAPTAHIQGESKH